ncbi:Methylphosphotriester-DNA--protein-cysteine S-methyltransferase [Cedecea neteri]|uniref:Methylphosphotriester-DNA--protein-cysteine S-methyltransferase n=1 Tax=Cedecea neteri TaxID=158822 RepID=A0A2X3J3J9_9ENTR|nr:Methylphosphotriester-DNA--protein-cysteine S-methyltransferase [Cedecea neteri]
MTDSMAKNLKQKKTLAQWADDMAMSERNLARLVVKETGLSFLRWRQQMQLIVALRYLISGMTVQNVAELLGYDSTTAFITMFKKALGTTPGRYLSTLAGDDFYRLASLNWETAGIQFVGLRQQRLGGF